MDTTTPVDGADSAQPTSPVGTGTTEAVADDSGADSASQTTGSTLVDDSSTSSDQPSDEAVADAEAPDTQATEDLAKFAKDKGFDPENLTDGERKALDMARNAEKKMHEATQAKPNVAPPDEVPLTGNEAIDKVIARQNVSDLKLYVRDWFDTNPDMKEYRGELTKIAQERPWLQNMDDVKAHFLADPSRADQLKREGGREALTNLAQKQQAVPPSANATNAAVFQSSKITSQNVDELVAKNDTAWYNSHREEIRAAAFGQTPS